ncbi:MAG TPA: ribonuclease P protein component [Thermoanaerobaculia bacterium]|nr:ribonuclease P protein component [Thermoanaerobaculia bacterium]HUM29163.1 ribonuclease P protein component [Thermoanaerobaculia bacterium]HXK67541.1 ribonuclease P protein component [Thermoanaerobaculia bacterium]
MAEGSLPAGVVKDAGELPSESFPRLSRLQHRNQFQKVFKAGKRFKGQTFTLIATPGDDGLARLGLTVKKTVNGVIRNRMRRRLKELYRRHRDLLPICPVWLVIHVQARGEVPFDRLHDDYVDTLRRLRTWFDSSL